MKQFVASALAVCAAIILIAPINYAMAEEAGDDALVEEVARAAYNRWHPSSPLPPEGERDKTQQEEYETLLARVKELQRIIREGKLRQKELLNELAVIYYFAISDEYSRILAELRNNAEHVTDIYNRAFNEGELGLCGDVARNFMEALENAHEAIEKTVSKTILNKLESSREEGVGALEERILLEVLMDRLGLAETPVDTEAIKASEASGKKKAREFFIANQELQTELEELLRAHSILGVSDPLDRADDLADCLDQLKDKVAGQRLGVLLKRLNAAIEVKIGILRAWGIKTTTALRDERGIVRGICIGNTYRNCATGVETNCGEPRFNDPLGNPRVCRAWFNAEMREGDALCDVVIDGTVQYGGDIQRQAAGQSCGAALSSATTPRWYTPAYTRRVAALKNLFASGAIPQRLVDVVATYVAAVEARL